MANLLLKRINDWATRITAFRTGDVIPVDGPSGTAKMSKDDLLKETSENAVNSGVAASQSEVDNIASNVKNVKEYTVPFFCVTDPNGYIALVVKNDGTTYCKITADSIKDLEELTENGFCVCDKNGYIGLQVDNAGNILAKPQYARMPRLILPERWNVVQGNVNYIFYESFLKNAFLGTLKIGSNPSKAIGDYLAFKYSKTGVNSLTFNLYDENEKVLDSKTIAVNVVAKTASGSFKICVCGDSKTDQASKLAELLNLCDKDGNLSVSFLGTQTDNNYDSDDNLRTIKNEGHSGMSVVDLCRSATLAYGRKNIFYDSNISATNKFNFALGVTALGDVPDILWIDHGYNNQWYNPADIKGCYDSIIQSVAAYNAANNTNVKVVISVQEWGGCLPYFYGHASGKDRLNDVPNTPQNYIDNFGDMEDDGVFICPQYFYVDPFKHYPYVKAPITDNIDSGNLRDVCFDEIHLGIQYTPYNASTTYNRGDKCQVSTKVGAVCLKDGTQGVTPTDDKIYWALTQGSNANYGYFRLAHAYFDTLKYIASLQIEV